jgi:hypothetical protein
MLLPAASRASRSAGCREASAVQLEANRGGEAIAVRAIRIEAARIEIVEIIGRRENEDGGKNVVRLLEAWRIEGTFHKTLSICNLSRDPKLNFGLNFRFDFGAILQLPCWPPPGFAASVCQLLLV